MTDLLNIAKECGAYEADVHELAEGKSICFDDISQLHATVEKVCGPLIQSFMDIKDSMTEKRTHMLANEAMAHYRNIMGKL